MNNVGSLNKEKINWEKCYSKEYFKYTCVNANYPCTQQS